MKTIKNIIIYAFIGMGLGTFANYLVCLLFINKGFSPAVPSFLNQFSSDRQAIGLQLIIFASLGISQGLASNLFKKVNERSNLINITMLHYALITLPLLLASLYLHWFQLQLASFLIMLLMISLIYTLVYIFNYLNIKKDIHQINQKLEQAHKN